MLAIVSDQPDTSACTTTDSAITTNTGASSTNTRASTTIMIFSTTNTSACTTPMRTDPTYWRAEILELLLNIVKYNCC